MTVTPTAASAALARALDYPYSSAPTSFLYANGEERPFLPPSLFTESVRVPVIGYGSNRAAEQLARKYPIQAEIPVEAAWLHGFDVVYAARIARYGAVPATIAACAGCRIAVKVLWLSPDQLPAMHASEAIGVGYDFGVLDAPLHCEHSGLLPRALIYVARSGSFAPEGAPLALEAIIAEGRRWPATAQAALQERMRAALAPTTPLEEFIAAHIGDRTKRAERVEWLAKSALPWQESRFRALTAEDPL